MKSSKSKQKDISNQLHFEFIDLPVEKEDDKPPLVPEEILDPKTFYDDDWEEPPPPISHDKIQERFDKHIWRACGYSLSALLLSIIIMVLSSDLSLKEQTHYGLSLNDPTHRIVMISIGLVFLIVLCAFVIRELYEAQLSRFLAFKYYFPQLPLENGIFGWKNVSTIALSLAFFIWLISSFAAFASGTIKIFSTLLLPTEQVLTEEIDPWEPEINRSQ